MAYIKNFKINDLFGYKDVEIKDQNDILILVGENGSGKSTIMNCLYYLLTKQFKELSKIPFESVEITFQTNKKFVFQHKEFCLTPREILRFQERDSFIKFADQIPKKDLQLLSQLTDNYDEENSYNFIINYLIEKKIISHRLRKMSNFKYYRWIRYLINDDILTKFDDKIEEFNEYLLPSEQILHFTTFRRIETHCNESNDSDNDVSKKNIIYGMEDVSNKLESLRNEIMQCNADGFNEITVSMLSRLVNKKPCIKKGPYDIEKVNIVLARLGSRVSKDLRFSIIQYCIGNKLENNDLNVLIDDLINLYEKQATIDKSIREFCDVCNRYFYGKKIIYDAANCYVNVVSDNGSLIELEALSSGEKQLVGLMAKMYLGDNVPYIVLIDEPELSLSLKWQEKLLPDMHKSGKIKYMMAVTHSPFIYNNDFKQYAKGMSNFVIERSNG